jgi:hypothetical protein
LICRRNALVKFECCHSLVFLAEICHFYFEKRKFSVHNHYLPNSCNYSIQIKYVDMSYECIGQFRIWSWFDDSWQSYPSWTLKKAGNFKFPFFTSPIVVQIQLKFDIKIHLRNKQLSFSNVRKILNFQFQHSYFCGNVCSQYFGYKYTICNLQKVKTE